MKSIRKALAQFCNNRGEEESKKDILNNTELR